MRLTSFVVSRSWASSALRTALTVLGIALGVAIVVAIHVVDHNTIQSQLRRMHPESGRIDFELMLKDPRGSIEGARAALVGTPGIASVALQATATLAVAHDGTALGTAMVCGLGPLPCEGFQHYRVESGEDLATLDGDRFVLVGHELAIAHGVRVGDRLVLSAPAQQPGKLCRDGRLVDVEPESVQQPAAPIEARVKGILAHERLARRNLGNVIVGSFALVRTLAPSTMASFQANHAPGANVDTLKKALEERFQVLDARSAMLGEAADERAFRNGVKVLGGLALVLGMFIVFETLSQSLVERLRQIGLLRCLGASSRAVGLIFFLDALLLALLGTVIGVLLGLLLALVMQARGYSTLGRGHEIDSFEVPLLPLVWTAGLSVAFTLAGALFPLWKARNLASLDVLSARGIEPGKSADVLRGVNVFLFVLLVVALPLAYVAMTPLLSDRSRETQVVLLELAAMLVVFGGLLLASPAVVRALGHALLWPVSWFWRLPAFLVAKSMRRSGGRFAAAVCGLGIVLIALLALKHITYALRGEVRQFSDVARKDRLYVRSDTKAITAEAARDLGRLPGVRTVVPYEGDVARGFPLYGIAVDAMARAGAPLFENPAEQRVFHETRSVIVSKRLALLRGLSAGSALRVVTDDREVPYTVLRVSDRVGFFPDERAFAVADPRWLAQDFCAARECVRKIALEIDPAANVPAVLEGLRHEHPEFSWGKSWYELLDYDLRDVTGDFALFDVLLALILLLAGVGLLNGMTITALGRTRVRSLGVLRALGMGRKALAGAFVVEGALTGLVASAVALAIGIPLGGLVVAGLNRVSGLEAPWIVPTPYVVATPIIGVLVGVLASVLPGLRATRESPAEAVRYE